MLGTPSMFQEGLGCNQAEELLAKYFQADVTSSVSKLGGSNMCTAPEVLRDVHRSWCWCCVHRKRWVHTHNNGRWSCVTCCSWRKYSMTGRRCSTHRGICGDIVHSRRT